MLASTSLMQGRCEALAWYCYLFISTYFIFLKAVLEDVLNDQAASLAQSDFVPHAAKGLVDISHDLRWRVAPAELEKLLPHMASISVDDRLRNTSKKLVNHSGFVLLRDAVKSLLHDMATEWVHAQTERISTNCASDSDDLRRKLSNAHSSHKGCFRTCSGVPCSKQRCTRKLPKRLIISGYA